MGFLGLLTNFRNLAKIGLIFAMVVLGSIGYIQNQRLDKYRAENKSLTSQIEAMETAVALTEKLRADNAKLNQELLDLRSELQGAAGYSDPLSADMQRIIGRLRF